MKKSFFAIMFLFAAVALVTGCNKAVRPDGLPKLVPAEFQLTQDGAPLAGASVTLYSDAHAFSVYGKSDETGKVVLKTYNENFSGAPVGNYIMTVEKVELTPSKHGDKSPGTTQAAEHEWKEKRRAEYRPSFDLVNPDLKSRDTTTLELAVADSGVSPDTLDVGAATREEFIPDDSAASPEEAAQREADLGSEEGADD